MSCDGQYTQVLYDIVRTARRQRSVSLLCTMPGIAAMRGTYKSSWHNHAPCLIPLPQYGRPTRIRLSRSFCCSRSSSASSTRLRRGFASKSDMRMYNCARSFTTSMLCPHNANRHPTKVGACKRQKNGKSSTYTYKCIREIIFSRCF